MGLYGKTIQTDAMGLRQEYKTRAYPFTIDRLDELTREYRIRAYPFTEEWLDELEVEEKGKREAQTLESLLVSKERNFVSGSCTDLVCQYLIYRK